MVLGDRRYFFLDPNGPSLKSQTEQVSGAPATPQVAIRMFVREKDGDDTTIRTKILKMGKQEDEVNWITNTPGVGATLSHIKGGF